MELKVIQPKPKTCAENMPNCNANCCRGFSFGYPYKPDIKTVSFLLRNDPERIHYYTLHEGVTAKRLRTRTVLTIDPSVRRIVIKKKDRWHLMFMSKCKQLMPDGKCALYGKPSRPKICVEGYQHVKKDIIFMPNCIYEPDEDSIVFTKEDLL